MHGKRKNAVVAELDVPTAEDVEQAKVDFPNMEVANATKKYVHIFRIHHGHTHTPRESALKWKNCTLSEGAFIVKPLIHLTTDSDVMAFGLWESSGWYLSPSNASALTTVV